MKTEKIFIGVGVIFILTLTFAYQMSRVSREQKKKNKQEIAIIFTEKSLRVGVKTDEKDYTGSYLEMDPIVKWGDKKGN